MSLPAFSHVVLYYQMPPSNTSLAVYHSLSFDSVLFQLVDSYTCSTNAGQPTVHA